MPDETKLALNQQKIIIFFCAKDNEKHELETGFSIRNDIIPAIKESRICYRKDIIYRT